MLMKYKDLKVISQNEMKKIKGGDAVHMALVCSCNGGITPTFVCSFKSYQGHMNCLQSGTQFLMANCGPAGGACDTSGPVNF